MNFILKGPPGSGPPGPGTPIMPSPQGNYSKIRTSFFSSNLEYIQYNVRHNRISDSSNSGGDNMYTLMKPAGGNMGGVSEKRGKLPHELDCHLN